MMIAEGEVRNVALFWTSCACMHDDPAESASPSPGRGVRERFPELIREFRTIARRLLRKLPAPSLAADDLVSEAFMRLVREEAQRLQDKRSELGSKPDAILKACFGAACRDVMSVRWRRRERRRETEFRPASEAKRGGFSQYDLADVHELLSVLAAGKPDTAAIVEARVFGDLSIGECAELFGVSTATVDRRWALGKTWIKKQLEAKDRRP